MELETPAGVEVFNLWTIWIMARLWEEYPRRQFFVCGRDRVYATVDPAAAGTPFGPNDPPSVQLFCSTMDWLLADGYLTGKANGAGHYALVGLTQKGFSVLKEIPRAVVPTQSPVQNKPLGALMRELVVSQGVSAAATALVKAMTGGR